MWYGILKGNSDSKINSNKKDACIGKRIIAFCRNEKSCRSIANDCLRQHSDNYGKILEIIKITDLELMMYLEMGHLDYTICDRLRLKEGNIKED